MSVLPRTTLLLALLTLTGAAAHAQATTPVSGPDRPVRPGLAVSAPGITVQPGDTAYSLARAHGLSVEALLLLNGLATPDLRVGQVLRVQATPPHSVQPGETFYGLSRRYGVSVDALLAANGLPRDAVLEVGQVLQVPAPGAARSVTAATLPGAPVGSPVGSVAAPAAPLPSPATAATGVTSGVGPGDAPSASTLPHDWRGAALALLGVPYVYGGTSQSGLDCSGFVLQVFSPLGVQLPRRSADQAQTGVPVAAPDLQAGDLVFFDTVGRGEVTHVGIYLGDNQFVNANSYKKQVAVDRLQGDPYWGPRLLGARRVLPPTMYGSAR
ncbi:peptidoglycan endopeptidase [Deinococcus budaensis]|uniref:Cell wall-associated NlpC family hydrolase n=1 Tax=Deinococcus budaensis TaxID=1665626 RepID=A0A7W8LNF7_9DEIO|nr:peptidoglycan endopeptidase [Deinococcus budaensis]MBB5232683.1 cell wall-associated NlpC family hydrolase [Deinococcus budaensis]